MVNVKRDDQYWLFVWLEFSKATPEERAEAIRFTRFLEKMGFMRFAVSCYLGRTGNRAGTRDILQAIAENHPQTGNIRLMCITNSHYKKIRKISSFYPVEVALREVEGIEKI